MRSFFTLAISVIFCTNSSGNSIYLSKVSYDATSRKVAIDYQVFGESKVIASDRGPVLLCVLDSILASKYRWDRNHSDSRPIEKKDLALLMQAANLLPETRSKMVMAAVKSYNKEPSQDRLRNLNDVVRTAIKEEMSGQKTEYSTISTRHTQAQEELLAALSAINSDKRALRTRQPDEKKWTQAMKDQVQKWDRSSDKLLKGFYGDEKLKKPEVSVRPSVESPFCRTKIANDVLDNDNQNELLANLKKVLDQMVPAGDRIIDEAKPGVHDMGF